MGDSDCLTLELDRAGRVRCASGRGVDLAYAYLSGELNQVAGTSRRSYVAAAGNVTRIRAGGRRLVRVDYRLDRVHSVATPAGAHAYSFASEGGVQVARVRSPLGTWTYRNHGDRWDVETPHRRVVAWLDARGQLLQDPTRSQDWRRSARSAASHQGDDDRFVRGSTRGRSNAEGAFRLRS